MAVKQPFRLLSGEVIEADSRTAFLLGHLEMLYKQAANGELANVFLARKTFTPGEPIGTALCFWDNNSLKEMSDTLFGQSKKIRDLASLWDGNSPASNRSFAVH